MQSSSRAHGTCKDTVSLEDNDGKHTFESWLDWLDCCFPGSEGTVAVEKFVCPYLSKSHLAAAHIVLCNQIFDAKIWHLCRHSYSIGCLVHHLFTHPLAGSLQWTGHCSIWPLDTIIAFSPRPSAGLMKLGVGKICYWKWEPCLASCKIQQDYLDQIWHIPDCAARYTGDE